MYGGEAVDGILGEADEKWDGVLMSGLLQEEEE